MLEIPCIIGGDEYWAEDRLAIRSVFGDIIASVPDLDDYSLVRSVRAARSAKAVLSELTYRDVCDIFTKAAHLYDDSYDNVIALARGNTIRQVRAARENVNHMLLHFRAVIERTFHGSCNQIKDYGLNDGQYYHEPVGIVAVFPSSTTREVAPHAILSALALGNPVIVKADSKEPFSTYEVAKHLYSAGLPRGALSVLLWNSGKKPKLGPKLIRLSDKSVLFGFDDTIKRIAYSGLSNVDSKEVASLALPNNIIAFGTGRSKTLVFDCHDIEKAADLITRSVTFIPSACVKTQFVVVESSRKDDFIRAYLQAVLKLRTGDLTDKETEVGHTIPDNRNIVDLAIRNAVAFGATKVFGDNVYTEPSLFDNLHPESIMFKEEIPAPCLGLVTANTLDEAISLINDSVKLTPSRKSLCVSVYTDNRTTYQTCLRRIAAYKVLHNKPTHDVDIFTPHQGIFLCRELMTLKAC